MTGRKYSTPVFIGKFQDGGRGKVMIGQGKHIRFGHFRKCPVMCLYHLSHVGLRIVEERSESTAFPTTDGQYG